MMTGLLFMWVGPFGIPDQMGLTSHDKCDSLESCTRHQTLTGNFPKAIPLPSYTNFDLVLDLDQALVPRIDMGPDLTLGPIF